MEEFCFYYNTLNWTVSIGALIPEIPFHRHESPRRPTRLIKADRRSASKRTLIRRHGLARQTMALAAAAMSLSPRIFPAHHLRSLQLARARAGPIGLQGGWPVSSRDTARAIGSRKAARATSRSCSRHTGSLPPITLRARTEYRAPSSTQLVGAQCRGLGLARDVYTYLSELGSG